MTPTRTRTAVALFAAAAVAPAAGAVVAGGSEAGPAATPSAPVQTQTITVDSQSTSRTSAEAHSRTEQRSSGGSSCSVRVLVRVDGSEDARTEQRKGDVCAARLDVRIDDPQVTVLRGSEPARGTLTGARAAGLARRVVSHALGRPAGRAGCILTARERFRCRLRTPDAGRALVTVQRSAGQAIWRYQGRTEQP